jgi:hypothetical protein
MEWKALDSCGMHELSETPQVERPRRLTGEPAESIAPGAEINSLI